MASSSSTTGSPCGACKFLRRKCASDCIFAPYFSSEQGPARFAAIHKVFGASNVSKLLSHIPPTHDRCEAVVSIAYEAQARIRNPVHGCVAHIFYLQQQVAFLQAQLLQVKAQLTQNAIIFSHNNDGQWEQNVSGFFPSIPKYPISPQSSLESVEVEPNSVNTMNVQEIQSIDNFSFHAKSPYDSDLDELQAIALRMMRNQS